MDTANTNAKKRKAESVTPTNQPTIFQAFKKITSPPVANTNNTMRMGPNEEKNPGVAAVDDVEKNARGDHYKAKKPKLSDSEEIPQQSTQPPVKLNKNQERLLEWELALKREIDQIAPNRHLKMIQFKKADGTTVAIQASGTDWLSTHQLILNPNVADVDRALTEPTSPADQRHVSDLLLYNSEYNCYLAYQILKSGKKNKYSSAKPPVVNLHYQARYDYGLKRDTSCYIISTHKFQQQDLIVGRAGGYMPYHIAAVAKLFILRLEGRLDEYQRLVRLFRAWGGFENNVNSSTQIRHRCGEGGRNSTAELKHNGCFNPDHLNLGTPNENQQDIGCHATLKHLRDTQNVELLKNWRCNHGCF